MGIHGSFGIRTAAQGFVVLVLLLLTPAQLIAQELRLEYEISNNPAAVKDQIYVNIFVNTADSSTVSVISPPLPKEVQITSGPKIDKVAYEGDFRTRISYRLRGEETGRYIIKPFIVTVGTQKLETDTEILELGNYRNRVLYMPLKAEWEVPDRPVYVGQSVPVSLRLLELKEIPLIENYRTEPPKGAFFDEVHGIREIETIPAGGKNLYNVPVASFMFTPSQSGRIFLAAAEVEALGETAVSPTVRVDVRPLPPAVGDSGAVGIYSYSYWLDRSTLDASGVAVLSIQVEGTGNIGYFTMPQPQLGDLVQTDVVETLEAAPALSGYQGTRRADFSFFSDKAGTFGIMVPDFLFFNPDSQTAETARGGMIEVTFRPGSQSVSETGEVFPFTLPSYEKLATAAAWGAYKVPLNYLWLLPAPLVFVVLYILKRTRVVFVTMVFLLLGAGDVADSTCPELAPAVSAYEERDFAAARDGFSACFHRDGENAGLAFALSLTYYQLEEYDEAIHYARRAIRLDPMSPDYREFLGWISGRMQLDEPVSPAVLIHPDIFFYAMVILLSTAFVAATVYLVKRKGYYIVLFLLGVLLALGSCGGLVFTAIENSKTAAIIHGSPAAVRKIPSTDAGVWLDLPPGYSLLILDSSGDFCLVRTAHGLTGWVEQANLLPDAGWE